MREHYCCVIWLKSVSASRLEDVYACVAYFYSIFGALFGSVSAESGRREFASAAAAAVAGVGFAQGASVRI